MDIKKLIIGLATALGISIVGNGILLLDSGQTAPVQLVEGMIELTGPAKTGLVAAITKSGAKGVIECRRGVISNRPADLVYCTDGVTAGWLVDEVTDMALVAEAAIKAPGVVAEILRLQIDGAKLYMATEGVRAP